MGRISSVKATTQRLNTIMLTALLVSACGDAPAQIGPVAPLQADKPAENTRLVGELVELLCIQNGNDPASFKQAISATGWPFEQTQEASPQNDLSLDVWQVSGIQVIRGTLVEGAIDNFGIWVSEELIDPRAFEGSLDRLAGSQREEGLWNFSGSIGNRYLIDFSEGPGASTRFQIFVEIHAAPWWRQIVSLLYP